MPITWSLESLFPLLMAFCLPVVSSDKNSKENPQPGSTIMAMSMAQSQKLPLFQWRLRGAVAKCPDFLTHTGISRVLQLELLPHQLLYVCVPGKCLKVGAPACCSPMRYLKQDMISQLCG